MTCYERCCDQTNESKQEEKCCGKIMEMMKNCCPGKEDDNVDCCSMMRKMTARNCCPDAERKSG